MTKFAQGQWVLSPKNNLSSWSVTSGKKRICACRWTPNTKEAREEAYANAVLIAAAPRMIAILKRFVGTCDNGVPIDFVKTIGEILRDAKPFLAQVETDMTMEKENV